jgi:hypothetical protein
MKKGIWQCRNERDRQNRDESERACAKQGCLKAVYKVLQDETRGAVQGWFDS